MRVSGCLRLALSFKRNIVRWRDIRDPIENECTEHNVFLLLLFQGTFLKCPLDWRILNYCSLYFYFIIKLLFGIDNSGNSLNPNHCGCLLSSQSMRRRGPVGIWTPNYLAEYIQRSWMFFWLGTLNCHPHLKGLVIGLSNWGPEVNGLETLILNCLSYLWRWHINEWTHHYKLWSLWVHLQKNYLLL